jgi:hypothetical protein
MPGHRHIGNSCAVAIIGRREAGIQFPERRNIRRSVPSLAVFARNGAGIAALDSLTWHLPSTTLRHVSFVEWARAIPSHRVILPVAATRNPPRHIEGAVENERICESSAIDSRLAYSN